jgi:hypothetical protein
MKRPSSARAVAEAQGKTTTKGIGKDKGKGKGKGKKGNGKGKGKPGHGPLATCHPPLALSCAICHMQPRQAMAVAIDDDDAARAAIRAEADAIPESTVEAIMVEARTRDVLMFILDMHRQRVNNRARFCARRLSMELDSLDRNAH